jgi:predicted HAD superfamily Cof-like phosphohydrolase
MENQLKQVKKFRNVFNLGVNITPTLLTDKEHNLHYNLLLEELNEYKEAVKNNDIVEIADALGNILYLAFGAVLDHGMQNILEDVFNEIHESNMSKLDENVEPLFREDGKIMKSNKYFPPNIERILNK